jgi:hypothetical protein
VEVADIVPFFAAHDSDQFDVSDLVLSIDGIQVFYCEPVFRPISLSCNIFDMVLFAFSLSVSDRKSLCRICCAPPDVSSAASAL